MASEIQRAVRPVVDPTSAANFNQSVNLSAHGISGFRPSAADPPLDLTCVAAPTVPGQVRTMLAYRLTAWGLPPERFKELAEDLRLIATELLTNAYQATPDRTIRILCEYDNVLRRIRVAVWDSSPAKPDPLPPHTLTDPTPESLEADNGRGLPIVTTLTEWTGITPTPTGKWIWAILPAH